MISGIIPRPMAFVSSISEDGVENLGIFRYVLNVECMLKLTPRRVRPSLHPNQLVQPGTHVSFTTIGT